MPAVLAALAGGHLDPSKAKVFHHHLVGLPAEHIARICADLLPVAGVLTTSQLAARLARAIVALDPAAAQDRYERALRDGALVAYLNADGTATLAGQRLPPDEVAAANQRIHQLAKQAKHAGHLAKLDHIKADI